MKATALTIFVTPLKGEEIRIEKACTLKQAVTLAKKEARKMIREDKGNAVIMINIQARGIYNTIESLAHIEATPAGRRVAFSDEQPTETYAICWGVEYKEEDGESNAIAETTNEEDAKELAENESKSNKCRMCVVRKSDGKVIAIYDNTPDNNTPETPDTMKANNTPAAMNEANVIITADEIDLYTATINGIPVGSVGRWFNNTFAASYDFGIRTLKSLAMPQLNNAHDTAHGFTSKTNAILWLGDMIRRYFAEYGITANIVNA